MVVFGVWDRVCVCAHPRQRQPKKGGSKGLLEGINLRALDGILTLRGMP